MVTEKTVCARLTRDNIEHALLCLADNGVDADATANVLQALCYILMDVEIEDMLKEDDYEL